MILRCRDCAQEARVQRPEAPRVWVCSKCDWNRLAEICPGPFDMASLRRARAESEALFNRATDGRLTSADALMALPKAFADMPDEAANLFERHVWQHFGMSLSDLHERMTAAAADAACDAQDDNRYRHRWFAQCTEPLQCWWEAQGFSFSRWRARDDDPEDNAPYLEFLSHELGRMESVDAADHVGIGSVQALTRLLRPATSRRPSASQDA